MKFSILFLGLLLGIQAFAQPSTPQVVDEIVAVIGNEIVLSSQIQQQRLQLKEQYKMEPDECEIIENILLDRLMLNQAKVDSITIPEQQLNSELDRRIRYYINLVGDQKKMEEFYGKTVLELREDFRDDLEDQMKIQQMQGKITEEVNVTPADVTKFYMQIPVDSLPLIGAQIELAQIVVYPAENSAEVSKTIEKLEKFRKEIVNDHKDFAVIASLYSEDPGSAGDGGDLQMREKGQLVAEFDAVAFSLKNGEVSKVFKTEYGYHFMQMIERVGEKYHARHILLKPKIKPEDLQAARTKLDSVLKIMKRDTMTFERGAVKFSMDEDTKNNGGTMVNPMTGSPRFDMKDIDPQILFTVDKLEKGEVSEPALLTTQSGKQGYRVIKVIERTNPHRANLKEDYQTIQEAASGELRTVVMQEWVNKKIKTTYIKIDPRYSTCHGKFNWKK